VYISRKGLEQCRENLYQWTNASDRIMWNCEWTDAPDGAEWMTTLRTEQYSERCEWKWTMELDMYKWYDRKL
jgi:hypothetical protein